MAGALVRMATQAGKKSRFRRMLEDGAVRGAAGAGRAARYGRDNAMPLLVGASVGGGAATAYQQTKSRREGAMYKSDSEYAYVTERLSKRLPSALRAFRAAGGGGRTPGGAYGANRVTANTVGRQGRAAAERNWDSQFGPGMLSRSRRAGATAGTGKLGVESGAASRGAAARKKRGQLVAARKPGQPGQRVLP